MSIAKFRHRAQSKYRRMCADYLWRRPFVITPGAAFISFTFDDFPATALSIGGAILQKYGLAGTYYISLGLSGQRDAGGLMFSTADLKTALAHGHELGCHTFAHCDSAETDPSTFMESVMSNRRALDAVIPGASFRTFSFPKSAPRARTKQKVGRLFECCRGGGQQYNAGVTDLNYLRAFFLEQAGGATSEVKRMIDQNRDANGWLIFATHDVCEQPSRFGCTPDLFEAVVRHAVDSGATILPVIQVWERLKAAAEAPCRRPQ